MITPNSIDSALQNKHFVFDIVDIQTNNDVVDQYDMAQKQLQLFFNSKIDYLRKPFYIEKNDYVLVAKNHPHLSEKICFRGKVERITTDFTKIIRYKITDVDTGDIHYLTSRDTILPLFSNFAVLPARSFSIKLFGLEINQNLKSSGLKEMANFIKREICGKLLYMDLLFVENADSEFEDVPVSVIKTIRESLVEPGTLHEDAEFGSPLNDKIYEYFHDQGYVTRSRHGFEDLVQTSSSESSSSSDSNI